MRCSTYRLDNNFTSNNFAVTIVGCGGTGGFAAEGLCRVLPPEARLVLIDHDRVEERNLTRQNFTREDLGRIKSEALARRLANKYNRPISYSIYPVAMAQLQTPGLIIGCVDNGIARRDIAEMVRHKLNLYPYSSQVSWWIDAGNGESYGQILIGNRADFASYYAKEDSGIFTALPLPTIQRPDLLKQVPQPQPRDCAQVAAEQGPTINQAMAALVVEAVRRLIEGTCSWMQLYLDLEKGTLQPVFADPEVLKDMKIKTIKEVKREQ